MTTPSQSPTVKVALRRSAEVRVLEPAATPSPGVPAPRLGLASPEILHRLEAQEAELEMKRRELEESRECIESLATKFTELYDLSPIGYLTVDAQGRILEANLTSAALLGRDRTLLLLGNLSDHVAPADRPALKALFAMVFSSRHTRSYELNLRRLDTTSFWANLQFRPACTDDDSPERYRIAISDITKIRTAKEDLAKQVLQAQEDERKRISRELHDEVSQTLVGVQLQLQVLAKQAGARSIALARTVARTQRMVEKSVDSIHSFARELRPPPLDERGLHAAMSTLVKAFAGKTGLSITFNAATDIPQLNQEVQTALYRVAQEAISNVVRHAGATEIEVSLTARPGAVCLIIRDNGSGFTVRDRFDNDRRKRLGLIGMSERTKLVGGSLTIESVPGKGTTIHACVPFDRHLGINGTPSRLCKINVLIADDHHLFRQGLRRVLEAESDIHVVAEAPNGRVAVEMTRLFKPDVVLMDAAMPVLNGLQATRQIQKVAAHSKVLILSASSEKIHAENALKLGAVGYLVKQSCSQVVTQAVRDVYMGSISPIPVGPKGGAAFSSRIQGTSKSVAELSSREAEVLQLVAEGRANKHVAADLGISVKTVEKHRQNLMKKLNIHDTAGLTRHALSTGLIEISAPLSTC